MSRYNIKRLREIHGNLKYLNYPISVFICSYSHTLLTVMQAKSVDYIHGYKNIKHTHTHTHTHFMLLAQIDFHESCLFVCVGVCVCVCVCDTFMCMVVCT